MTTTSSPGTEAAVTVRQLTKRYGPHLAVDGASFTIPKGHIVGLIGPNGAGKTTVMKAMVGLVAPTGGDIDVLGTPVGAPNWGRILSRVGSIIEEPALYCRMTARQNLAYQSLATTRGVDRDEIDELLDLIGLADRADDRPARFSLGMRQRLGIGLTLIGSPELVILDEPANGLDPAGIAEIRSLLRRLPERGCTVLVSSHQLAEVEAACDSVVVLHQGRVVTAGTTADIVAANTDDRIEVRIGPDPALRLVAVDTLLAAGCEVFDEQTRLLVRPPAGASGSAVARLLAGVDIYPEALIPEANTLEDAFLNLTENPTTSDTVNKELIDVHR